MPFTRRQDIQTLIEQTGIETSPAGLTASDEDITETLTGTGARLYTVINMGALRFLISGTLTIDPLSYSILTDYDVALDRGATAIIINGTFNIGVTTVSNGYTSRSVGNTIHHAGQSGNGFDTYSLDVRSGGTLNINGGTLRLSGTLNITNGANFTAESCNIVIAGDRQVRSRSNNVTMRDVRIIGAPLLIYEAPAVFETVTVENVTTPIGSTRNIVSIILYGGDSGGTGNFSSNTGLTILREAISQGGVNDYGVLDSGNHFILNTPNGSSASVVSWLDNEGVIQRRRGYLRIGKEIDIRIFDVNGNRVSMDVYFARDTNNGNRQDGSATLGFDDTPDIIYTGSIQATGSNIIIITTGVFNKHDGNEVGGVAPRDRRGTDVIDTFVFNLWDYRFNHVGLSPSCLGLGILTVIGFALPDTSITNLNQTEVLAYTGITIDHTNQQIVLSRAGNVPIEEIVDFAKMDKLVNVEIPTARTLIYTVFGSEVRTSYNLVINDGTTLTGTPKFNSFRSSGIITGLNNVGDSATVFDSTFDSNAIITLPTGYDTVQGFMTVDDANNVANALFTGTLVRYDSTIFGGTVIFLRVTDSNDATTVLIRGQLVPVEAGTHNFLTVAFGESQQLTRIIELSTEIRANQGNQQVTISQDDIVSGLHRALRTTEPLEQREIAENGSYGAIIGDIASNTFPYILVGYFRSNNVPSGITETGSFTNTYTAETTENATGSRVVVTRTAIGGGMTSTFTGFRYDHHSDAIDFLSSYALGTLVTLAMDVRILQATTTAISSEIIDFRVQTSSSTTNAQTVSRDVRVDSVSRTVYFDLGAILNNSVNFFALVMFFDSNSPATQVEISRFRITTRQEALAEIFTDRLGQTQLTTILDNSLSGRTYPNAVPDSIAEQLVQTRNSVRPYLPTKTFDVRPRGFVPINPQDSFNFTHSFVDGEELMVITKTDAEEEDGFTLALSSNTVSVTEDDTFSMTIRITETNLTTEIHEPIRVRANFIIGGTSTFFENSLTIGREPTVLEFRIVEGTTQDVTIHTLAISSTGQNEWRKLEIAGLTVGRRVYVKDVTKDAIRDVLFEESPDKYRIDSMHGFIRSIFRGMNPVDNVASLNLALRELVPVNPADNFTVTLLGDELNIWYNRQDGDEPITSVTVFFAGQPFRLTRNQTIMMSVEIEASVQASISVEDFTFILRTRESADETLAFTQEVFVGDTPIEVAFITGLSRETITVTELTVTVNDRTVNIWEHLRLIFGVFQTDEIAQLVRANGTAISTLRESLQGVASLTPTSNV